MISGSNFKERAHFAYFVHSKIFICYDIDDKLETRGNTNMTALTNFPKTNPKSSCFFLNGGSIILSLAKDITWIGRNKYFPENWIEYKMRNS